MGNHKSILALLLAGTRAIVAAHWSAWLLHHEITLYCSQGNEVANIFKPIRSENIIPAFRIWLHCHCIPERWPKCPRLSLSAVPSDGNCLCFLAAAPLLSCQRCSDCAAINDIRYIRSLKRQENYSVRSNPIITMSPCDNGEFSKIER